MSAVQKRWKNRTNWFFAIFRFFDRNFETLAIEIFEIRFHIQIPRNRIMLNPYFQLIPLKIANFKGNCYLFFDSLCIEKKQFILVTIFGCQLFERSFNFYQTYLSINHIRDHHNLITVTIWESEREFSTFNIVRKHYTIWPFN